jgi:hypothetical protein
MIDLSEETSIVSNLVFVDSKVPDFEYILEEYKQVMAVKKELNCPRQSFAYLFLLKKNSIIKKQVDH